MLNSKGNLIQKKTKPSGQQNKTVIVALDVSMTQNIRDPKKEGQYELAVSENLAKDVQFEEYVTIKAYPNTEKTEKDRKKLDDKSKKDEKAD